MKFTTIPVYILMVLNFTHNFKLQHFVLDSCFLHIFSGILTPVGMEQRVRTRFAFKITWQSFPGWFSREFSIAIALKLEKNLFIWFQHVGICLKFHAYAWRATIWFNRPMQESSARSTCGPGREVADGSCVRCAPSCHLHGGGEG